MSAETGSVVERMCEENYVFPLPKFRDDLLHWLSKDGNNIYIVAIHFKLLRYFYVIDNMFMDTTYI